MMGRASAFGRGKWEIVNGEWEEQELGQQITQIKEQERLYVLKN